MRVREIRELSADDLAAKISDTRKQIVEMRFHLAMRKLESTAKLRNSKKDLARLLTIQTELEQNNQHEPATKAPAAARAKKPAQKKATEKKPAVKKQPAASG